MFASAETQLIPQLPELELNLTLLSDMFGEEFIFGEESLLDSFNNTCDEVVVMEKTLEDEQVEHESCMNGLRQLFKQAKLAVISVDDELETVHVAQPSDFSAITIVVNEPASRQDGPEPQTVLQGNQLVTGHRPSTLNARLSSTIHRDRRLRGPQHAH